MKYSSSSSLTATLCLIELATTTPCSCSAIENRSLEYSAARYFHGHSIPSSLMANSRTLSGNETSVVLGPTDLNSSTYLIVGAILLAGIFLLSIGLYALDVYVTSRIDRYLLDHYGPSIYEAFTGTYDPNEDLGNIPYLAAAARSWTNMSATERIMKLINAAKAKFEI